MVPPQRSCTFQEGSVHPSLTTGDIVFGYRSGAAYIIGTAQASRFNIIDLFGQVFSTSADTIEACIDPPVRRDSD